MCVSLILSRLLHTITYTWIYTHRHTHTMLCSRPLSLWPDDSHYLYNTMKPFYSTTIPPLFLSLPPACSVLHSLSLSLFLSSSLGPCHSPHFKSSSLNPFPLLPFVPVGNVSHPTSFFPHLLPICRGELEILIASTPKSTCLCDRGLTLDNFGRLFQLAKKMIHSQENHSNIHI